MLSFLEGGATPCGKQEADSKLCPCTTFSPLFRRRDLLKEMLN